MHDYEYKVIRDPIYGYIGITQREKEIIDTPKFQRLRRIKQLAMADLLYPGAHHTRFEHSIGVMHVAGLISQRLNQQTQEDIIDPEYIRIVALLHDIGHGPFSHVFENILLIANKWDEKITHERITLEIIKRDARIASILEGDYPNNNEKKFRDIHKDVINFFENKRNLISLERDIIDGPIDADKIDYLRRDSYYCGVAYGLFDFDRVIHTLSFVSYPKYNRLVVLEKGRDSLESFRLARYLMHTQVYQHHVRLITDAMIVRATEMAIKERIFSEEDFQFSANMEFIEKYTSLTDEMYLQKIYRESKGTAREIVKKLYERKLLKRGFEKNWQNLSFEIRAEFSKLLESTSKEKFSKLKAIEREIAKACNTREEYIVIYPRIIKIPLYKSPDIYSEGEEQKILIKMKNGKIYPIDEVSPLTTAQFKADAKLYVFCPPNKKDIVRDISEKIIEKIMLS